MNKTTSLTLCSLVVVIALALLSLSFSPALAESPIPAGFTDTPTAGPPPETPVAPIRTPELTPPPEPTSAEQEGGGPTATALVPSQPTPAATAAQVAPIVPEPPQTGGLSGSTAVMGWALLVAIAGVGLILAFRARGSHTS